MEGRADRDISQPLKRLLIVASISQITKGGSWTPLPGGGWKFDIQFQTKFKWDTAAVKKKLAKATREALYKAGADVREATRKQMSSRAPSKNGRQWQVGERMGYKLIARIDKVPKSDRVTSWRTSRFPGGYLRSQIQSDFDSGRKSVVVGPEVGGRNPRVNYLLERGGTATYYFVPGGKQRRSGNTVYGTLSNRRPKARGRSGAVEAGVFSFTRPIRPRRFMEKGLAKALPKIPECFRGRLRVS